VKLTKQETAYTDKGTIEEHCSACKFYVDRTTCKIVAGAIKPGGWCNKFKATNFAREARTQHVRNSRARRLEKAKL